MSARRVPRRPEERRTERELHEAFWTTGQRAVTEAENAIREARGAIQMHLAALDEPGLADAARILSVMWLDRYGR